MNNLRSRAAARSALLVAAVSITAACGGESTGPSQPTSLVFVAGENQTGPVGSSLSTKIVVEARAASGPAARVSLVLSVEASAGGGSVTPATAITGTDGRAEFTWRLGGKLGVQTLTASTTGQTPLHASVTATATAGPPAIVVAETAVLQFVVVGQAVPTLPSVTVTDAFGNPLGAVPVNFSVLQPGSVLIGTQTTTDAAGHATLAGWTIGPDAVVYGIRAEVPTGGVSLGPSVVFEARGIPATVTIVEGASQTANVGTAVPIRPAVKAAGPDGSPLPGVAFTFSAVSGGGTITGGAAVSGADGIARPAMWVLGLVAGLNRVDAVTFGKPALSFEGTGVATAPANVIASGGTTLSGIFGNYLKGAPEVTVTDASGNPVAGAGVNFTVSQGDGAIFALSTQTDFEGKARAVSWRLGGSGTQSVSATVAGLTPVVFTATALPPPAGTFRVEVRYDVTCNGCANPTPGQRAAFDAAIARWTQLILAGGAPYTIKPDEILPVCGNVSGTIDGVVIVAQLSPIDGVNGVLGSAFPCIVRDEGFLPVTGVMRFDTADLVGLEANGTLNHVILHEMAHVLGFGTMWNFSAPGLPGENAFLIDSQTSDPFFNGAGARAAFYGSLAPGTTYLSPAVPVEAGFGPGTRLSHWRESSFATELMTGFLSNQSNPLSAVTVQQFGDLGYVVDDATADNYSFQGQIIGAGAAFRLVEEVPGGYIIVINRQGKRVGLVPRIPFK